MKNITNKSDCLQAGYRWIRRKYNFDNLIQVRVNGLRTEGLAKRQSLILPRFKCPVSDLVGSIGRDGM